MNDKTEQFEQVGREIAEAVRAETFPTFEGLDYVGTFEGVRVHVGDKAACTRVFERGNEWAYCARPDGNFTIGKFTRAKAKGRTHFGLNPACLKAMLSWARDGWTDLPCGTSAVGVRGVRCPCGDYIIADGDCACPECGVQLAGDGEGAGDRKASGQVGSLMPVPPPSVLDTPPPDPAPTSTLPEASARGNPAEKSPLVWTSKSVIPEKAVRGEPVTIVGAGPVAMDAPGPCSLISPEDMTINGFPIKQGDTVQVDGGGRTYINHKLQEEASTYPGLTYAGTAYGCRIHVGDKAPELADYKFPWFPPDRYPRQSDDLKAGKFTHLACTPEVLAVLDTWVEWTERACVDCGDDAGSGLSPPRGPLCTPCLKVRVREQPQEVSCGTTTVGIHDPGTPYLGLGTEGQLVDRHPPEAPPPEPILTVEDGRVRLWLDRLSEDRVQRAVQLIEAPGALIRSWGDKGVAGSMALVDSLFLASDQWQRGWPLAPHLRAIEYAHQALCTAQCRAASKAEIHEPTLRAKVNEATRRRGQRLHGWRETP
jgi:hypothetical protein